MDYGRELVNAMTDEIFTAEELAAFRAVDRLNALEPVGRGAERWERRQSGPEPEPEPEKPQPSRGAPTMDEAASQPWNDWALALVRGEIEHHEKVMVDATAEFVAEYVTNKLKALEAEVASLRADLTIMRSVQTGGVIDLPNWRRADAA
jgi:hypothetical protein